VNVGIFSATPDMASQGESALAQEIWD
jgi:hypothetical protein